MKVEAFLNVAILRDDYLVFSVNNAKPINVENVLSFGKFQHVVFSFIGFSQALDTGTRNSFMHTIFIILMCTFSLINLLHFCEWQMQHL